MDLVRCSPQSHLEVPHSTVLCRVMQSFLQHSKKAEGNLGGQGSWQILCLEINLHFLLLAEFLAEAPQRRSETQVLQSR